MSYAAAYSTKRFTKADLVLAERMLLVRSAKRICRLEKCGLPKAAKLLGVAGPTLWRFVRAYDRGGKAALRTQTHKSGRRSSK